MKSKQILFVSFELIFDYLSQLYKVFTQRQLLKMAQQQLPPQASLQLSFMVSPRHSLTSFHFPFSSSFSSFCVIVHLHCPQSASFFLFSQVVILCLLIHHHFYLDLHRLRSFWQIQIQGFYISFLKLQVSYRREFLRNVRNAL